MNSCRRKPSYIQAPDALGLSAHLILHWGILTHNNCETLSYNDEQIDWFSFLSIHTICSHLLITRQARVARGGKLVLCLATSRVHSCLDRSTLAINQQFVRIPYLFDQTVRIKIIDVKQVRPPFVNAWVFGTSPKELLAAIPKRAISKECDHVGEKQNRKHVAWRQPE